MWINDGSLAKQSHARAFAWSNESTFRKRGYIQYINILRCSFHTTAKRLSITGLTHLLRLRSKIQSSIVRHLPSKSPTTKMTIWSSFCATFTGTNLSLLLTGLSYTICDFATTKTDKKYEVSRKTSKTLNCQGSLTILVLPMTIKHKNHELDYFTIYWRHPIDLNNNITDISQKKRSAYKH